MGEGVEDTQREAWLKGRGAEAGDPSRGSAQRRGAMEICAEANARKGTAKCEHLLLSPRPHGSASRDQIPQIQPASPALPILGHAADSILTIQRCPNATRRRASVSQS